MDVDKMIQRSVPRVLQYGVIQMILFVLGIMLAISVVSETGVISPLTQFFDNTIHNVWIQGGASAVLSSVLDTFATSMSFFSLHQVMDSTHLAMYMDVDYLREFTRNGMYWKIMAYSSAMGGNFLLVGSVSGLALIKMERVHIGWYFKNAGWISIVAWIIGLTTMWLTTVVL